MRALCCWLNTPIHLMKFGSETKQKLDPYCPEELALVGTRLTDALLKNCPSKIFTVSKVVRKVVHCSIHFKRSFELLPVHQFIQKRRTLKNVKSLFDPGVPKKACQIQSERDATTSSMTVETPSLPRYAPAQAVGQFSSSSAWRLCCQ
jgi:hypothetical protein